ncbi:MAG: glycosyl hydrolase, partial [Psychroserpens sp.]|nr:glycosyl hydrolase [Psychroserpens sp.]
TNSIPDKHLVWRIVQDHVAPNLLFIGTEFGLFFSVNGGSSWTELNGNVPTISFRDLAIQKRENDLVAASFGRGFFVLDDYSALREVTTSDLNEDGKLFPVRDAWWYIERPKLSFDKGKGSQGDSHYVAPNPDFGALLTYYLKEVPKLKKEQRQETEKKNSGNINFPGWDALEQEKFEDKPQVMITIKNQNGEVIRNIMTEAKAGLQRINWDLRYPNISPLDLNSSNSEDNRQRGFLAAPGTYSATLHLAHNGNITQLDEPVSFNVKPLYEGSLPGSSIEDAEAFWRSYEIASKASSAVDRTFKKLEKKAKVLQTAITASRVNPQVAITRLDDITKRLNTFKSSYYGNQARAEVGEKNQSTVADKLFTLYLSLDRSTYGPTETNKRQIQIINTMLDKHMQELNGISNEVDQLENELNRSGAPYIDD